MNYLLGIDVGTSGTKVALYDQFLKQIDSFTLEYDMQKPYPGWAEQDPDLWWQATRASITHVLKHSKINPNDVKGIGITGQMHGLVMLDENNKPLRPSILWCDTRTEQECAEMTEELGLKRLIEITANPALPGFTASKIRWVEKNEPSIFKRCQKIMLPKDYVRFCLTGCFATDVSDASGMQLLDIRARQWSPVMLSLLHISIQQLGTLYESAEVVGKITAEAARLTGLAIGIPVIAGAGDQAASAIGNGIVTPGDISITIGSSGVVFAPTDTPTIDPRGRFHTFCHAVPNAWHVMGVTQGAGASLKWFKEEFCEKEMLEAKQKNINVYDLLNQEIETVSAGSNGVLYLPYLQGERTPHLDAKARGVFFGISSFHQRKHLLRAVMEGVSFSLFDCYGTLRENGLVAKHFRLAGGGARSDVWTQMLADIFNEEIERTDVQDSGTLGCAILAGVGIKMFSSIQEACMRYIRTVDTHFPDPKTAKQYIPYYSLYHSLYPTLKESFQKLSRIKD